MKKKLLVLAPLMALVLTGCFSRTPTNKKKRSSSTTTAQTSTSGGSTTSGGSSGTSGGSSGTSGTSGTSSTSTPTPPGPTETHGTLDNPITVSAAKTIGNGLSGQSSQTVYDTIDAYVKGVVQTEPEQSTQVQGTYRFKVADSYTSDQYIMFYWGRVNSGATLPSNGDEVTLFGRIANYNNGGTIELAGKKNEIDDPLVMKSNHREVAISVNQVEHATVSSIPTKANTGDTISFTVTADTDYSVDSVKVNGVIIPESSGTYSFKVADTSTILITIVEGQVTKSDLQKAYEAALALPNDTASTDAYTFSGVVVGIKGNSYYLQNDGYGMLVYNHATEGVAMGKNVSVTSTIKQYNGLPETASVTSAQVTGDGTLPTAAEVTSMATLSALKVNVLANVAEATFVSKTKDWTSSNNGVRFTFTIGSDDIVLNMDKNGYNADKAAIFNAATAGDKYVLGNLLTNAYNTTAQLAFAGDTSTVQKITTTPTSIEITSGSSVTVGDTLELTATVGPTGASQAVTWAIKSGNEYASLDGSVLTGTAAGTVVVTATATGTEVSTEKSITVNPLILTSLSFTSESFDFEGGDVIDLNERVTYAPSAAEKDLSFEIKESVESTISDGVLTVSENDDQFHITVTDSVSGLHDECTVNVVESIVHVTGVTVSPEQAEMDIDDVLELTVTVFPNDASDKTYTVVSADPTVVEVTGTNSVTARSGGNTTVTVTTTDGSFTATCAIVVHAPAPEESVFYTVTTNVSGSNNSYNGECDVAVNGITWNVNGNSQMDPWRFGGKSLTAVDRTLYSKTALAADITKVVMNGLTDSGAITVNSIKLIVSSEPNGAGTVVSELTESYTKGGSITFVRPSAADWGDCYFKFVFNVTVSGSSNKYVAFTSADFYALQ